MRKTNMKKKIIILFLIITALIGFVLLFVIRWNTLPDMEGGVVYKNHVYVPLSSHYDSTTGTIRTKNAVGKFHDAIIYTLRDDPDEFFLYPKAKFFHENYVLFGRQDLLSSLTEENVQYVAVYVPNSADLEKGTRVAAQTITLNGEQEQRVLAALRDKGKILTDEWKRTNLSTTYGLRVYFEKPKGMYYETEIVQYGETYGLLLEDGKTLVDIGDILSP